MKRSQINFSPGSLDRKAFLLDQFINDERTKLAEGGSMLQPLTSEAQQVIASYHLGIPTAAYRAKFAIKKAFGVAFLLVVGLGILIAAFLDSSSMQLSTLIAVVIVCVLFLAFPIWIVVDAVRSRDIEVYVCPAG